ncbi:RyR domain-containing protein [Carnobacterium antarcticum]|uniref:RyR domain-containing protein n=1 Tax=Carnobacterium antarcticum TaxID=2126436 RepID=A0ABW4NMK8_9LACT|nr:RyR domain-containing protein [Carnobacterium sp. CP1]ALV20752.1 Phage protein [Carnobacterium sp. CP1]
MEIKQIAKVCHNVNKAYCESIGDDTQTTWEEAPNWQQKSAVSGVLFHLENDVTPEQSHENWLKDKVEDGWVYGDTKDVELKTHPCIVPYDDLPIEQRTKDFLFKAVVDSL